jgi:NADH-quinone oxidoreductase subunit N
MGVDYEGGAVTDWHYEPELFYAPALNNYKFFLLDNLLIHDIFYVWLKLLFLFLFFIFVKLLQMTTTKLNNISVEQPFLIVSLLFFGLIALMSLELNLLYLCFEAITIIVAVLIALQYSEFAIDAAIKYFSLSAIASGLLIFGASIFYGNLLITDLLSISDFFFFYTQNYFGCNIAPLQLGFSLIIISFFIKLSVWPGNL